MVDKRGKLRPLRITSAEFLELASMLDESLPPTEGASRFHVSLGNLSDYCRDSDYLRKFLTGVGDKVVREFSLTVWSLVSPEAEPRSVRYLEVTVVCWSWGAYYLIGNARSMLEAEGIAAAVTKFRDRHAASTFLNPTVGYYLALALVFAAFIDGLVAWSCFFPSCAGLISVGFSFFWTAFRFFHILYVMCSLTIVGYIAWSYSAETPPPLSFRHSILYMDREPKNNLFWAVILAFLVSIIGGAALGWLAYLSEVSSCVVDPP
jgi:hypothetical protein